MCSCLVLTWGSASDPITPDCRSLPTGVPGIFPGSGPQFFDDRPALVRMKTSTTSASTVATSAIRKYLAPIGLLSGNWGLLVCAAATNCTIDTSPLHYLSSEMGKLLASFGVIAVLLARPRSTLNLIEAAPSFSKECDIPFESTYSRDALVHIQRLRPSPSVSGGMSSKARKSWSLANMRAFASDF